jgi:hypothetical protein
MDSCEIDYIGEHHKVAGVLAGEVTLTFRLTRSHPAGRAAR